MKTKRLRAKKKKKKNAKLFLFSCYFKKLKKCPTPLFFYFLPFSSLNFMFSLLHFNVCATKLK